jgi:hypothetical protein
MKLAEWSMMKCKIIVKNLKMEYSNVRTQVTT